MSQLILPMRPEEATGILLKKLPSRRMRNVIEKRFGLKGGKKKTLEAIGKEYKITRERVRQIEQDALKHLSRPEDQREIEPLLHSLKEHIRDHGGVVAENHFSEMLSSPQRAPHLAFLLEIGEPFLRMPESDAFHPCWTTDKELAVKVGRIVESGMTHLASKQKPIPEAELHAVLTNHAREILGEELSEKKRQTYLATSKHIKKNPLGEFGLAKWPTVSPRGVKDKAYLVLAKSGSPLHFREVAKAINTLRWTGKKAHPQTVHNELIKDDRFVLVGRGLYALKEWGYEPGTVRDILVSVLKEAGSPLPQEEVIRKVLEKRFVKPPTVLLNLQDKSLFRKTEEEKYTLV